MSDWEAEQLRVTVFHKAGVSDGTEGGVWKKLTGAEPDRSNRDPRTALREEAGFWDQDTWLTVHRIPGRVDAYLTPVPPELVPEPVFGALRTVGKFDDQVATLRQLGKKVIEAAPSEIQRLALGAVLLVSVADPAAANARLKKFLPGVSFDPQMTDFLYQVNRPRSVPLSGNSGEAVLVNRLSKWNAVVLGHVQLLMQGTAVSVSSPLTPIGHACRAELDLSSDAQRVTPLAQDQALELFSTLVDLGAEIAERGDVP